MFGNIIRTVFCFVFFLLFTTCVANRNELFGDVDELFYRGEYQQALTILEDNPDTYYPSKDRLLFYLDTGMLAYYAGNYRKAIQYLGIAEDEIDRLYTKRISQNVASHFTNDLTIEYAGEEYEDLYCNIFKALAFLQLNEFDSAYVEMRRLNNKLSILEQKTKTVVETYTAEYKDSTLSTPDVEFNDTALGRYLSFLIYLYDNDYDNAGIDLRKLDQIFANQKNVYNFSRPKLGQGLVMRENEVLIEESMLSSEEPYLRVLIFSGAGAIKRAARLYLAPRQNNYHVVYSEGPAGSELVIRDIAGDSTVRKDNYSAVYVSDSSIAYKSSYPLFELPVIERRENIVSSARILVNYEPVGNVSLLESVDNIAVETFRRKQATIYFKTVTRVLIKHLTAAISLAVAENSDSAAASIIAGLTFITATSLALAEQADLRGARFFPAEAFLGEFAVGLGEHVISIEYLDDYGRVVSRQDMGKYRITEGLNLITGYSP